MIKKQFTITVDYEQWKSGVVMTRVKCKGDGNTKMKIKIIEHLWRDVSKDTILNLDLIPRNNNE